MSLVMNRIQEHYSYATANIDKENVLGIFLIGSQNYGVNLPSSDIDTKLLITPKLENIYQNKTGESKTFYLPCSDEQVAIKDIRFAFKEFKKQNINALEILFTDYCIVNKPYQEAWQNLINQRELIARYDPLRAIKSIKGNVYNTFNRIYLPSGEISHKQVANLVRYEYFLKHFINNESYEKCIHPDESTCEYILQIRTGNMGENSLQIIADNTFKAIQFLIEAYEQRPNIPMPNPKVEELLNQTIKSIIDTSFFIEYARNGEM